MTSLFGLEKQEVVRIKVKKCEGFKQPEYKKLCVDPQLTSFDIIRNLLARAFNIKSDFTISYLAKDDWGHEMYLSLLSDWDLDAAFLSASNPCLRLKVDTKPFEEGLDDWDIVAPLDVQPHRLSSLAGVDRGLLGQITGSISSHVGKTVSQVSKVMGLKTEEQMQYSLSKSPMTDAEFRIFLDSVGHLVKPQEFRMCVYQGGVEPSLRSVVWRHLLNIFPDGLSGRERFEYTKKKSNEYFKLRDKWRELFVQGKSTDEIKFVANMVKKDVLRTDRTHDFYAGSDDNQNVVSLFHILVTYALSHPDVSYCQGMSDIASPLLVVQKDEAAAYLCLCGLMKRLKPNFMLDGIAMTTRFQHLALLLQHRDPFFYEYLRQQDAHDMFFCYRWLLLELKREFPFDDALIMLEVMWSSLPPDPPDEELELALPEHELAPLHCSPPSPSVANHAYLRLKSLCRQTSAQMLRPTRLPMAGADNCKTQRSTSLPAQNVAITPMEGKELDPKDFIPVADTTTQDLMNRSTCIDRSLEGPLTESSDSSKILDGIVDGAFSPSEVDEHSKDAASVGGHQAQDNDICLTKISNHEAGSSSPKDIASSPKHVSSSSTHGTPSPKHTLSEPKEPAVSPTGSINSPKHIRSTKRGESSHKDGFPSLKDHINQLQSLISSPKNSPSHKSKSSVESNAGKVENSVKEVISSSSSCKEATSSSSSSSSSTKDVSSNSSSKEASLSDPVISSPEFLDYSCSPSNSSPSMVANGDTKESLSSLDLLDTSSQSTVQKTSKCSSSESLPSKGSNDRTESGQQRPVSACDNLKCGLERSQSDKNKNRQLTVSCPGAVEKDENVPDSPRRPTEILLRSTCTPGGVADVTTGQQGALIRGVGGEVTERTLLLDPADINSCEEAVESPAVNFPSAPVRLPPLPPPQEFGCGNPFLMFLAVSLLLQQRDHIIRNRMDYNELAMHLDKLVRGHHVKRVLHQAQSLFAEYIRSQHNSSTSSGSMDSGSGSEDNAKTFVMQTYRVIPES